MDKTTRVRQLERLDAALQSPATLYIYGSCVSILMDEPNRTSLDLDVAGPYSVVDEGDLRRAGDAIGFPVNPGDHYDGDHIEWIGPLRLCLPPPAPGDRVTLWQGARLRIQTASIADLIASKLVRYDQIDQTDIEYLLRQNPVPFRISKRPSHDFPHHSRKTHLSARISRSCGKMSSCGELSPMRNRNDLQYCYELAFYPPRLNELWAEIRDGRMTVSEDIGEMCDNALLLHKALPQEGYSSQRALNRLAAYQAQARAFGLPAFLGNLRRHLGRPPLQQTEVPPHLVRDIGLPPLSRR
jgi:hypothetical protein